MLLSIYADVLTGELPRVQVEHWRDGGGEFFDLTLTREDGVPLLKLHNVSRGLLEALGRAVSEALAGKAT